MQHSFLTISKKVLLYPYYFSFVFFVIACIDLFFTHGTIKAFLPKSLSGVFLLVTIFEFPHILASFFMLGDSEYQQVYKKNITKNLLLFVAVAFAIIFLNKQIFYLIFLAYTFYHVVQQQFGIAKFYGYEKSSYLDLIKICFIVIGAMSLLSFRIDIPHIFFSVATLVSFFLVCIFFLYEKTNRKNPYLALYVVGFFVASILFGSGYTLFGYLSMRIVHDVTAFIFYSVHNYNRKPYSDNPIFMSFFTKSISPLVLTPVLAICLNILYIYTIKIFLSIDFLQTMLLTVYFGLSLAHYNLEGSIWKKGSLARNYIRLN